MKKKNKIIISTSIIILAIILIVIIIVNKDGIFIRKPEVKKENFVYEGIYEEDIFGVKDYVITSYEDYHKKFGSSNNITKDDFKSNNFVLIPVMYDSCSESNIKPTDYSVQGNNIEVTIEYDASCGVCAPEYIYYLLRVDKNITKVHLNIKYVARNDPDCDPNVAYKPMIYLYPEKETSVIVKLGYKDKLTTTYPKYDDGWKVMAFPNGDLYDEFGKYYYGLYWEGLHYLDVTFEDGFVVEKDNLIEFFEEKLTLLGLNDKERNEFIIYWLPILEQNEYNLIRFETIEKINEEMPLEITPNPDTLIRVLMEYKPVDRLIDVKEQVLETPLRRGFTVVEWGGTLIK